MMSDGKFRLNCNDCGVKYDNAPLIAERDELRARLAATEAALKAAREVEREACAAIAVEHSHSPLAFNDSIAKAIAAAIRARSQSPEAKP